MTFTKEAIKYALEVLPKMREILTKPENWCQGGAARTLDGKLVAAHDPKAFSFCLIGAHGKVNFGPAPLSTSDLLDKETADFNDSPTTTHQDILNLLDERIAFFRGMATMLKN